MNSAERAAAVGLAGRAAEGITTIVQQTHAAITARVHSALGAPAIPLHRAQAAISTAVYTAVRGGLKATTLVGGLVAGQAPSHPPTAREHTLRAALNGAIGGQLATEANPLAIEMGVHVEAPTTARAAVLIHGLGESGGSWRLDPDYRVLLRQLGWTPVVVTYNSGLKVAHNGELLARELADAFAAWPDPLDEIALIGHSMGGLVARAAMHPASAAEAIWVSKVARLITLGTPHDGAPLARLGQRVSSLAGRLPETRALGTLLDYSRAPGIADLCHGDVHADPTNDVELPDHVTVRTLCVTLGPTERHLLSRAFGDLLVMASSATSARSGRRTPEDTAHVGGLHHFDLLGHPQVWNHLETWLR